MKLSYVSLKKKFLTFRGRYILNPAIFRTLSNIYNGTFYKKWLPDTLSKPKPKNKKDPPKNKFPIFREKEHSDSKIKKNYIFLEMEPCTFQPKLEK